MDTPPIDSVPPFDLELFRVPSDVDEAFYIPNFITLEEEQYLLRKHGKRHCAVDIRKQQSEMENVASTEPFLASWSISKRRVKAQEYLIDSVPSPPLITRLKATGAFSSSKHGEPNHIIVNEYHPGQGIMPHEDGSSYHPVVATVSLGSHAVFHYHRYRSEQCRDSGSTPDDERSGKLIDPQPILSLLLEPRSLIITAKNLYQDYLHSIESVESDIITPAASVRGYDPENNGSSSNDITSGRETTDRTRIGYQISNWELLADEENRRVAKEGGTLHRKTRVSMTCRDVEKILLGKGLGSGFSKLQS